VVVLTIGILRRVIKEANTAVVEVFRRHVHRMWNLYQSNPNEHSPPENKSISWDPQSLSLKGLPVLRGSLPIEVVDGGRVSHVREGAVTEVAHSDTISSQFFENSQAVICRQMTV